MREIRLIKAAISKFQLDLRGINVLTECASGNFIWLHIIAALAGGNVTAYGKDSRYGKYKNIVSKAESYARLLGLKNIEWVSEINEKQLSKANIITNSGLLRPLNKTKLSYCNNTVIPLMYETWEYRANDVDISYCHDRNIPVLGTNEYHPFLKTIHYLGVVAKKLLFESGIEVFQSKIGIIGSGKFADSIISSLHKDAAECRNISLSKKDIDFITEADAIIIADHESDNDYFKRGSAINAGLIKKINPSILLIHISGGVDLEEIESQGIALWPKEIAPKHYMSITTDYAGPKPVIDLHTAGLKVGEIMMRLKNKGYNYDETVRLSLKSALCQDFSHTQKNTYFMHK